MKSLTKNQAIKVLATKNIIVDEWSFNRTHGLYMVMVEGSNKAYMADTPQGIVEKITAYKGAL